jgi:hypothetical protein
MDPDMTVRQLPLHRQGYPESYAITPEQADPHMLANAHLLSNMLHGSPPPNLIASVAGGYGVNFQFAGVPGAESYGYAQLPSVVRHATSTEVQAGHPVAEASASASSTS